MFIRGKEKEENDKTVQAILNGYYTAYYLYSGKKAKKPEELIKILFRSNIDHEKEMGKIRQIKELENRRNAAWLLASKN